MWIIWKYLLLVYEMRWDVITLFKFYETKVRTNNKIHFTYHCEVYILPN